MPGLQSFLQETIATQLHLGLAWFTEQLHRKHQGIKPDPDSDWAGLYDDDGSCVDIIADVPLDQQGTVQIVNVRTHSPHPTGRHRLMPVCPALSVDHF